jgi:prepilin-type N-terminal cleavage/methylation domain-containing protein
VVSRRGYTLLEVVIAMAIFGTFLAILFQLTAEMRNHEKRLPVNMHRHPQVMSVLARLRRDVHDAHGVKPYRDAHDGYQASKKVLILETVNTKGGVETAVWDLRVAGEARRRAYIVGNVEEWVTRGLPAEFEIEPLKIGVAWAAHVKATDEKGRLAIDAILQPRATE